MASLNSGLPPSQTPSRDNLIKVTFQTVHDTSEANASMYVAGSLPSLGAWDAKRARKMSRAEDGSWTLAIYIPERAEFLYQYLLLQDQTDLSKEPVVLWEGVLERRCKLNDAGSTPSKQLLLSDDTRGEANSPCPRTLSYTKTEAPSSSSKAEKNHGTSELQEEITVLLLERTRCLNELQKLKDIIGHPAETTSDFKQRESYAPSSGPLYDIIRQLQSVLRNKTLKENESSEPMLEDGAVEEAENEESLRKQIEELNRIRKELEEAHRSEKQELVDSCQESLRNVSLSKQVLEEAHAKSRAQLRTSVHSAAQSTKNVRQEHSIIRTDMLEIKKSISSFVSSVESEITHHVARVAGNMQADMVARDAVCGVGVAVIHVQEGGEST